MVAASVMQAGGEFGFDAEPLQHGGDLRAAAVHDDGVDRGLLQEHDVAGKGFRHVLGSHRVSAIFDDDGLLVIFLHMRQRFRQDAGLIERADFGRVGHEADLTGAICGAF